MRTWIVVLMVCLSGSARAGTHLKTTEQEFDIDSSILEVVLDIDFALISIMPSGDHSTMRVRAVYERGESTFDAYYDRDENKVLIEFSRDDWNFHSHNDDNPSELIVELPMHPSLDIDIDVHAGEVNIELGGLSIERFNLDIKAGETDIAFSKPNRISVEKFRVHSWVGETEISCLGNANCIEGIINSGIGALSVDFSGENNGRCETYLDLDIGETNITIPDDIDVKLRYSKLWLLSDVHIHHSFSKHGGWYRSSGDTSNRQSLILEIESGIGELNIMRD